MVRFQLLQRAGIYFLGGAANSFSKPEKGHNGKLKIKDADHLIDASTNDDKYMNELPWMELE